MFKQTLGFFGNLSLCSSTFKLGEMYASNHKLQDSNGKFTYFAPGEQSWNIFKMAHPVVYKALFAKRFAEEEVVKVYKGIIYKFQFSIYRHSDLHVQRLVIFIESYSKTANKATFSGR